MTYQFLTGWTFGTMYPEFISALNTGASSPHSMPSYLKFDLTGLVGVDAEDIESATPCACTLRMSRRADSA